MESEAPVESPNQDIKMESDNYASDLTEKIGKGGFATVYKGWKKTDESKIVAIKELKLSDNEEESQKRKNVEESARRELQVLRQSCHDENIIKLLEFKTTTDKSIYIVMEYCEQGDLQKYMERKGKLDFEEKMNIMMQCAKGVNYLHNMDSPIIHRDIKLQNILIKETPEGKVTVKITDFGVAKILSSDQKYMSTYAGTAKFCAPEQLKFDNPHYTAAVDIFSLGLVYFVIIRYDSEKCKLFDPNVNPEKPNEPYLFFASKLSNFRENKKTIMEKEPTLFEPSIITSKVEVPVYKLITEMVRHDYKKRYDIGQVLSKITQINENVESHHYDQFELKELLLSHGLMQSSLQVFLSSLKAVMSSSPFQTMLVVCAVSGVGLFASYKVWKSSKNVDLMQNEIDSYKKFRVRNFLPRNKSPNRIV